MKPSRYLTAREAAQALGVSLPTVYAYVSRGLLRSEATGAGKRERRYLAEDVQRLQQRQEQRRQPEKAVTRALHWGTPILESAITLIAEGKLFYRGHDAVDLAAAHSAEAVAALIWTGQLDPGDLFARPALPLPDRCQALWPQVADLSPMERFQVLLPALAAEDLGALDLRRAAVLPTGSRLLRWMAVIAAGNPVAGQPDSPLSLAETLARGWAPRLPQAPALINQALVLCADHELNVSSFTARCVASAGSPPYAAVSAGLAALQGVYHGGHTERVLALFREAGTPAGVRATLARWLKRGERLPGFGHQLYPDGDPRGAALLAATVRARPRSAAVRLAQALAGEVERLNGERPTIDFSLVTLALALHLPAGAPLALFALGRTIGWIGHALEQYEAGRIIRPRARYTGPVPATPPAPSELP